LFTGIFPMLVLYIVMAMVIPNGPGSRASAAYADQPGGGYPSARPRSSGSGAIVLGVLLIIGGGIALLDRYVLVDWRLFGPFVVVGFGALLIGLALTRRP
jgi:hypothetical protein